VVVPALVVRGSKSTYLLSAEIPAGAEQRGSFATVAEELGMRVRIPTEAELARWGVTLDGFPAPRGTPAPHEARIAGTVEFRAEIPGWVGSWRMRWKGADYAWSIRGVNYDEAFRDIVRGVLRVASGHGAPK
jgi:hypothetical protein